MGSHHESRDRRNLSGKPFRKSAWDQRLQRLKLFLMSRLAQLEHVRVGGGRRVLSISIRTRHNRVVLDHRIRWHSDVRQDLAELEHIAHRN